MAQNIIGKIVGLLLLTAWTLFFGICVYHNVEVVTTRCFGEEFDAKITNIKVTGGRSPNIIFDFEYEGKICCTRYGYNGVKVGDVIKMRRNSKETPSLLRNLSTKVLCCLNVRIPGMELFVPSSYLIFMEFIIIAFLLFYLSIPWLSVIIYVTERLNKQKKSNVQ